VSTKRRLSGFTERLNGTRPSANSAYFIAETDINRLVSIDTIAGIEFYLSANRAPVRYQSLNRIPLVQKREASSWLASRFLPV
jgi:hypothetical protein